MGFDSLLVILSQFVEVVFAGDSRTDVFYIDFYLTSYFKNMTKLKIKTIRV